MSDRKTPPLVEGAAQCVSPPTRMGARNASAPQTIRITSGLVHFSTGANARTQPATAGKKSPTTKTGHAIESSSATETASCFLPGRRPNSAVTDQPKIAWMMLPIFLPMKLRSRETNATSASAAALVPSGSAEQA